MKELNPFAQGYIDAALWSSLDADDQPLDRNYTEYDIDEDTLGVMIRDCERFQRENKKAILAGAQLADGSRLCDPSAQAGHDFWLTRNGDVSLFVDDDGQVYSPLV